MKSGEQREKQRKMNRTSEKRGKPLSATTYT